ncbi:MAG: Gfo/Idh/MocA family oxidoreductase [bacterium]
MDTVHVGLIGSGFISEIHAQAFTGLRGASLLAVASPTEGNARAFAEKHGIPHSFTDYRKILDLDELDLVVLGLPNDLHCQAVLDAASAGKHVVCEKPLCMNLGEADRMIGACKTAGVKLMYAEELCFAPKYVRLKSLVDEGALGQVYLVKQSEKHDGPHSGWFWDVNRSGGGVTMDMGCHAFEFFRWMLGKPKVSDVYADMKQVAHSGRTQGDDSSHVVVTFDGGITGLAEESWVKKGGMDDRAEAHGTEGVAYADLLHGNAILTYSDRGYGYAVEKAATTKGWSFTMYEEIWNYGFPQEMQHFVDCVRDDLTPLETGEDGRIVLEMIFAAYRSAAEGRKVPLPYSTDDRKPIDPWLSNRG